MKKHKTNDDDQQWFDNQIGEALDRFDAIHAPLLPKLHVFEQLVQAHKRELKRKLWKDLLLFWLLAVFIFSSMMWVLDRNWVWFLTIQSAIAAGGIGFVSITFVRRMGSTWRS
ncbi:YxlC family protein [Paenibacillus sp. sgz302251]|uniref:YxlC family protein n=1 Tax=Paenibacillus sp. sgz302251 TaxID=3414493 RepID=UPI003C7D6245